MSAGGPDLAARVGARLRSRRTALKLRLADVAADAGVSVSHLSAIEKGASVPSLPVLARIAHAVGLTIHNILEDEQRPRLRHGTLADAGPGAVDLALPDLRLRIAVLTAQAGESGGAPVEIGDADVFVHVREGTLAVALGEERYELYAGDSLDARDAAAIAWEVVGAKPSVSIWATTRTRAPQAGADGSGPPAAASPAPS